MTTARWSGRSRSPAPRPPAQPCARSRVSAAADLLRSEYQTRLQSEESATAPKPTARGDGRLAALQRQAVRAQRDALTDLRARSVIGDDAFHVVEEDIDLLELTAETRVQPTRQNTS